MVFMLINVINHFFNALHLQSKLSVPAPIHSNLSLTLIDIQCLFQIILHFFLFLFKQIQLHMMS